MLLLRAHLCVCDHVQAEEVILQLGQACLVARHLTMQLVNLQARQPAGTQQSAHCRDT